MKDSDPLKILLKKLQAGSVREIISAGESDHVEFKQILPRGIKVARVIVGFANTLGGVILVGVADDGRITGLANIPRVEKEMQYISDFLCSPPVKIEIYKITISGKRILAALVPESRKKPHKILKDGKDILYVKVGDKVLQASKETERMIRNEPLSQSRRNLGRDESAILKLLADNDRITIVAIRYSLNYSRRRAERALVSLVRKGVLYSHDINGDQFYTLR
ncbi:MAG: hypothetical protein CVV64_04450 [Candidatus Wallbacteria bacterium HGW-Wallbacteria-1]|jgi:predicted HTH transcriptional regulator|uniref:Schlafen AlbA-2 domain-containing protein n=1 Tax=Candidatus Wallbacteria bacterium HGW-Wallbacteria-1 TaxID=2013854 RepID=A0A2N1PRR8_9BACT|nr:MAG: hypothetical protein CVV64_04450 [Candidatus Wallbacteria bacterium HGW-Wallbacteria-1]